MFAHGASLSGVKTSGAGSRNREGKHVVGETIGTNKVDSFDKRDSQNGGDTTGGATFSESCDWKFTVSRILRH